MPGAGLASARSSQAAQWASLALVQGEGGDCGAAAPTGQLWEVRGKHWLGSLCAWQCNSLGMWELACSRG